MNFEDSLDRIISLASALCGSGCSEVICSWEITQTVSKGEQSFLHKTHLDLLNYHTKLGLKVIEY